MESWRQNLFLCFSSVATWVKDLSTSSLKIHDAQITKLWGDLEELSGFICHDRKLDYRSTLLQKVLVPLTSLMLWMQQSSCFVVLPQNTELQDVAAVKSQRRFASARWFRALTCDHRPAVRQSTLSTFPGWFRPVQRGGGVSVWLINMQQHKDQKRCEHRRSFLAGWESSVCVFSSKRKLFLFFF